MHRWDHRARSRMSGQMARPSMRTRKTCSRFGRRLRHCLDWTSSMSASSTERERDATATTAPTTSAPMPPSSRKRSDIRFASNGAALTSSPGSPRGQPCSLACAPASVPRVTSSPGTTTSGRQRMAPDRMVSQAGSLRASSSIHHGRSRPFGGSVATGMRFRITRSPITESRRTGSKRRHSARAVCAVLADGEHDGHRELRR